MTAIFSYHVENQLKEEFFGRATPGFFVEVGANNPVDGSQTWHLEQLGWDGVLIEPQRDLAERSRQQRRAKVYAVACSSPADAGKTMTLNLVGFLSSLNPGFFIPDMVPAGVAEVPIMTLDQILVDAKAPAPLDLVSIDVESHEIAVLSGFDLARWRPRLILIEDFVVNRRLHRYLTSRGYKWVRRTGLNGWYIPAGQPFPISLFGRLQFIRKYYLGVPFRAAREILRPIRHRWKQRIARSA